MIHRVIYGSIERFFGILVEHFAGKFPLWMAPVQAAVLPLNDDLLPFAKGIAARLEKIDVRTSVDPRSESLNKKVRDAQLEQIPLILTCGGKEKENGTISVRTLDGLVRQGIPLDEFERQVMDNIRERKLKLDFGW
jgi:threonyl-tRNA synthetase